MLNPTSTQQSNPWQIAPITPTGLPAPVSETLPLATQRLVEGLQPEKIILFGSYAYGTPTPDSDVDLLVVMVMETNLSSTQRFLAVSRLLSPRPFPVDILVKRPNEIKRALAAGDFFIKEIISQGKVLYER